MSNETEIMNELIQKAIMRTIIKISSAGVDLGWPATNPAKQAILFFEVTEAGGDILKLSRDPSVNFDDGVKDSILILNRRIVDALEEIETVLMSHEETIMDATGGVMDALELELQKLNPNRCTASANRGKEVPQG